jgi:hypothetical protein
MASHQTRTQAENRAVLCHMGYGDNCEILVMKKRCFTGPIGLDPAKFKVMRAFLAYSDFST